MSDIQLEIVENPAVLQATQEVTVIEASDTALSVVWSAVNGQVAGVNAGKYASLNEAVAVIGDIQTTLFVDIAVYLSAACTVPDNITVVSSFTGLIDNKGYALHLERFKGDLSQHFTGSGVVSFGTSAVEAIQGQWFGMIDDGSGNTGTNNTTALNKAIVAAASSGIPLETNGGIFLVKTPVHLKSGLVWRGNGTIRAYLNGASYNRAITTEDNGVSVSYRLERVKISGPRFEKYQDAISGAYHLVIIHNAEDLEINGCYFHGNISRLKDTHNGGSLAAIGITIGISPFDQYTKKSKNIRFLNNVVEQGWNAGFQVGTVETVIVTGNNFLDCIARGVDVEVSVGDDITQGVTITGNTFRVTDNVDGGALQAAQITVNEYGAANNPENQQVTISNNTFVGERATITDNGAAIMCKGGTGIAIIGNVGTGMLASVNKASIVTGSSVAGVPTKPQKFTITSNSFDGKMQLSNLINSTIVANTIDGGNYDYALTEDGTALGNVYMGNVLTAGTSGVWSFAFAYSPRSIRIGNVSDTAPLDILSTGASLPGDPGTGMGQFFFRSGGTGQIYAYNITDAEWVGLNLAPTTTRKGPVYQAAHLDPATATTAQIVNALIAAKIMSAT